MEKELEFAIIKQKVLENNNYEPCNVEITVEGEYLLIYPIHGNVLHAVDTFITLVTAFDMNCYADIRNINGIDKVVLVIF